MAMRLFIIPAVVILSSAVSFSPAQAAARSDPGRQASAIATEPVVAEAQHGVLQPASVPALYEELQSKNAKARPHILNRYPASVQAAVWLHHFLTVLRDHPEFNDAQRRVLTDVMALLTPRLFELDSSDPEWSSAVDVPMREITARANRLFSPQLVRELLADMGPPLGTGRGKGGVTTQDCDDPYHQYSRATGSAATGTPATANAPNCTCTPQSDYCDWGGLGEYYCKHAWCVLVRQACGTFWRYDCVGLCHQRTGG